GQASLAVLVPVGLVLHRDPRVVGGLDLAALGRHLRVVVLLVVAAARQPPNLHPLLLGGDDREGGVGVVGVVGDRPDPGAALDDALLHDVARGERVGGGYDDLGLGRLEALDLVAVVVGVRAVGVLGCL